MIFALTGEEGSSSESEDETEQSDDEEGNDRPPLQMFPCEAQFADVLSMTLACHREPSPHDVLSKCAQRYEQQSMLTQALSNTKVCATSSSLLASSFCCLFRAFSFVFDGDFVCLLLIWRMSFDIHV